LLGGYWETYKDNEVKEVFDKKEEVKEIFDKDNEVKEVFDKDNWELNNNL